MKKLVTSAHIMELFMPYLDDEKRVLGVIDRLRGFDFYHGVEMGVFYDKENQKKIRRILEEDNWCGVTYSTPYMNRQGFDISSLDPELRKKSVDFEISLMPVAAEMGLTYVGVPSGPDTAPEKREAAKEALADSFGAIADAAKKYGISLLLEPLDRYAHKKRLLGPMDETCEWFAPVQAAHPNMYIHWDSAHEQLGDIDLFHSLDLCESFLQRIHLCNCIKDRSHPCFGDLHMEVGQPPLFETEGFLTPEVGAALLDHAVQGKTGVDTVYVSVEVLGHPGDDLWHKEYCTREFLKKCFELMKAGK